MYTITAADANPCSALTVCRNSHGSLPLPMEPLLPSSLRIQAFHEKLLEIKSSWYMPCPGFVMRRPYHLSYVGFLAPLSHRCITFHAPAEHAIVATIEYLYTGQLPSSSYATSCSKTAMVCWARRWRVLSQCSTSPIAPSMSSGSLWRWS